MKRNLVGSQEHPPPLLPVSSLFISVPFRSVQFASLQMSLTCTCVRVCMCVVLLVSVYY